MAEIKSSIEIAMEKTKHLILDEEGKKALREKELREKISAILRRFMSELIDKDGFLKEYEGVDIKEKERILFDIIVEEYDFFSKDQKVLALFDLLKKGIFERLRREIETFKRKYDEELEKRRMIVRARVLERLKEIGLTGDGFEPNLEVFEEWKNEEREVLELFKKRIKELKKDFEKID